MTNDLRPIEMVNVPDPQPIDCLIRGLLRTIDDWQARRGDVGPEQARNAYNSLRSIDRWRGREDWAVLLTHWNR